MTESDQKNIKKNLQSWNEQLREEFGSDSYAGKIAYTKQIIYKWAIWIENI